VERTIAHKLLFNTSAYQKKKKSEGALGPQRKGKNLIANKSNPILTPDCIFIMKGHYDAGLVKGEVEGSERTQEKKRS